MNRRELLALMGAAAAGTLWKTSAAHGFGANDTINIAGLGVGGRFRHLMGALAKIPNVRLVAVCDVWDRHLDEAKKLAVPGAFATRDYRAVLDRKDVDAVIIASPDHWHVPMTVDACAAGKDVYVEKPLTHDLSEGPAVIEAQNRHKRIVQVGMQQRSMPQIQKAREIVKSGRIGHVYKAHLTWNRNLGMFRRVSFGIDPKTVDWKRFLGKAKDRPFDDFIFRNWRPFWDFGGGVLTDLMVHWLDVVHWICDLDHPAEAVTIGDHFGSKGVWEAPDTIQTLLRYPDRELQVHFEGTFLNARYAGMCVLMGTEATIYIDRGRYELIPEKGKGEPEQMILGSGPRGADFYDKPDGELLHLTEWVECMRTRRTPNTPAEAGVSAAAGAHLGNIAYRTNQTAKWNAAGQAADCTSFLSPRHSYNDRVRGTRGSPHI